MNPKVDFYFKKAGKWQDAILKMRTIALDSGLTEELKWGCPCYTLNGANVFLIHTFKAYCAYLFMKGALMKDAKKLLIQQTANVQSARQIRFTDLREVLDLETTLKAYIKEAIKIESAGLKVVLKKTTDYAVPPEFAARLKSQPQLKKAFESLTPGRQRAYLFFIGSAKQSATREARVEKCVPAILAGKGLDD
jgi:uncharacterized protein YdeI (YjbR/CyaY-like superfamily)